MIKFIIGLCLMVGLARSEKVNSYSLVALQNNCSLVSNTGNQQISTTTFSQVGNGTSYNISLPVDNSGSVWATVSSMSGGFKVDLTVTINVNGTDSKSGSMQITQNGWQKMQKNKYDGTIKNVYVETAGFATNASFTTACLNMGVAYDSDNTTSNVTTLGLACWNFGNDSILSAAQDNSDSKGEQTFAESIAKDLCSGACNNSVALLSLALCLVLAFVKESH